MPEVRLIDANALLRNNGLDKAVKYGNKDAEQQSMSYSTMMLYEIADMIEDAPTIDAEPVKHAYWESWGYVFHGIEWKRCSACGKCAGVSYYELLDGKIEMETPAICGCCGARMDLRTPTEVQLDEADSVMMGGSDNG